MPSYERMYHILFNAITDGLRCIERGDTHTGMLILADAQCQCEELYITAEESPSPTD